MCNQLLPHFEELSVCMNGTRQGSSPSTRLCLESDSIMSNYAINWSDMISQTSTWFDPLTKIKGLHASSISSRANAKGWTPIGLCFHNMWYVRNSLREKAVCGWVGEPPRYPWAMSRTWSGVQLQNWTLFCSRPVTCRTDWIIKKEIKIHFSQKKKARHRTNMSYYTSQPYPFCEILSRFWGNCRSPL